MTLEIISSSSVVFKGEADMVTLPGALGSFTVLQNHAPLISVLTAGKVVYRAGDASEQEIEIKGGLVDVDNNVVAVCIY